MIDLVEIAWIAGLLEGEGHFSHRHALLIQLTMTDKDVVERTACLVGIKKIYERVPKDHRKPSYSLHINGYRAAAWMLTIYSFMGDRRKKKIRDSLIQWTKSPSNPRAMRGERLPEIYAICHPKRPRYFKMFCQQCWTRMKYDRDAMKRKRKRLQAYRCIGTGDLFK